jgi:ribosome-associated heat shock protein Hsp15
MENITPKEQYDMLDVIRISGFIDRRKGLGRPTKREGRDLAKFTDNVYSSAEDFDFDTEFDFDEDDFDD